MKSLLSKISKLYGKAFHSYESEPSGYVNTGGYIKDEFGNTYYFKQYSPSFTSNILKHILKTSLFFKENGIPASVPINLEGAKYYAQIEERYYGVFEIAVGIQFKREEAPEWMYEKLGEFEARMYKIGGQIHYEKELVDRVKINRKEKFYRIYKEILPIIKDQRILETLQIKKDFIETVSSPEETEEGFVLLHGDLTPENIFWKDKEVSGVIDFDTAQIEHPYFHILRNARITLATNGYGEIFEKRLRQYLKGYQSITLIDESMFIKNLERSRYKVVSCTWAIRETVIDPSSPISKLLDMDIMNTQLWANKYEKLKRIFIKSIRETA